MKKVYLKWQNIAKSINKIADNIKESGFKPDAIISIGRGGMIPARLLSDILEVKNVSMISAKLYTGIGARNSKPTIGAINTNIQDKNVLIVDDIVDTGITIDAVIDSVNKYRPSIIRIATLVVKDHVKRLPSYYDQTVKEEEWIVFPWELKEFGE